MSKIAITFTLEDVLQNNNPECQIHTEINPEGCDTLQEYPDGLSKSIVSVLYHMANDDFLMKQAAELVAAKFRGLSVRRVDEEPAGEETTQAQEGENVVSGQED